MPNEVVIPEVGMGATAGAGSDCYPYTIHRVDLTGKVKKMWVSNDNHTPTEKHEYYGNQDYTYSNDNEKNPEAWELCTLRKDGYWHFGTTKSGQRIYPGTRRYYQDPSF